MVAFLEIVVLLFLSATFSGSETAIFAIDRIRLKSLVDKKVPGAALLERLRKDPKALLGTLLLCNNAVNVGISALATILSIRAFGDAYIGVATGVITFLLVVFGEYMPKSYAAHHSERTALLVATPIFWLTIALRPIVKVVEFTVRIFISSTDGPVLSHVGEDDIRIMAKIGAKEGTVERGEKELIDRVFLFNDITANDVLTPRELMVNLETSTLARDAVAVVNAHKYSRYPVIDENGSIVGIVHIKDILDAIANGRAEIATMASLAAPHITVADDMPTDDLFRQMKKGRVHMAIVASERSGVVGLVTLEDLLEELVGEIADESDVDEHVIKRVDKYTLLVHGDTDIPDINRFFNVKIEGGDMRTIGRVVSAKAGKSLKQGQPVMIAENLMAIVEESNRSRVLKVRLIKSELRPTA